MIDHDVRRFLTGGFVLLLMCSAIKVSGQVSSGAGHLGLGNASVALAGVHSIGSNASGIAKLEKPVLSLGYAEYFLNSDTRSLTGKLVLPIGIVSLGFYGNHDRFGSHFQETSAGLTISKSFQSDLAVGIITNYHFINIPDEKQINAVSIDIGGQYTINQTATIGLSLRNFEQLLIDEANATDQATIAVGAAYQFSYQTFIATEFSYLVDSHTDLSVGVNYLPMTWLVVRGGLSVNPFMRYVGLGVIYNRFNVDVATSFHAQLGYSPQISIDYRF